MPPDTPGRTPGKRARERPYVLFNDNPRERGTHSGRPMPTDVPVNEDGFEDPTAFMKSPSVSVTNSASRRTTLGGPSSAGTSRRTTLGRMSQLDGSDDDDDMNLGPDATLGEEEYDAANSTFFGISNPATVPLPRRSELAPATPGTNVDDLPSPSVSISRSISKSASKRKSTLGGSPSQTISRRSIATTINRSPLTSRSIDFDDDSMLLNDDEDVDPTISPRSRRQSRRTTMATENGGDASVDMSRYRNDRRSMASRKSYAEGQSIGTIGVDDENDQGMEQSYAYDNGGGGQEDDDDLMADEEQAESEIALDDDTAAVGDEVAEDEDTGEETAVERPPPKARKGKIAKTAKKLVQRSRQRSDSSSSSTSPIKRARVSGFPLVPREDEGERYKGDFKCRRSGRSHIEPLKWWIGERVEYQPGEHLAEVREIVRLHEDRKTLIKKRNYYRKTTKQSLEPSDLDDGTGYDEHTEQKGLVADYLTGIEDPERRIAMPHDQLQPQEVSAGGFKYQKVFGEEAFAAAGVIRIPVGSKKPGKSSKDNAFFFFVHKGGLNVNLHRTSFNMGPGAMFMVPRGNKYSIENISGVEAELFFAQARKAIASEEEEQISTRQQDTSFSQTPGASGSKSKKKKTKSVEPETDAESAVSSKKKTKKKKL